MHFVINRLSGIEATLENQASCLIDAGVSPLGEMITANLFFFSSGRISKLLYSGLVFPLLEIPRFAKTPIVLYRFRCIHYENTASGTHNLNISQGDRFSVLHAVTMS